VLSGNAFSTHLPYTRLASLRGSRKPISSVPPVKAQIAIPISYSMTPILQLPSRVYVSVEKAQLGNLTGILFVSQEHGSRHPPLIPVVFVFNTLVPPSSRTPGHFRGDQMLPVRRSRQKVMRLGKLTKIWPSNGLQRMVTIL
jgi:hypothetical protein